MCKDNLHNLTLGIINVTFHLIAFVCIYYKSGFINIMKLY